MLVDGYKIANDIGSELKKKVSNLNPKPGLGIILAGDDKPSQVFVAHKIKFCEEVGIKVETRKINGSSKNLRKKLESSIKEFNRSTSIHGIILQLPLPKNLIRYQPKIFQLIAPEKDIDCFNPINLGLLNSGNSVALPAVVKACLAVLENYRINLKGKVILVIGWGQVVGKPLVPALLRRGATVIVCHQYTKNLPELTQKADVIISAAGKPKLINSKMVKKGIIVLDVGASFAKGKIMGDFDFATTNKKARLITPVPGGIGPITVAMVAKNTLECCLKQIKNKSSKFQITLSTKS